MHKGSVVVSEIIVYGETRVRFVQYKDGFDGPFLPGFASPSLSLFYLKLTPSLATRSSLMAVPSTTVFAAWTTLSATPST